MKGKVRRVILIVLLVILIGVFAVSSFMWARNVIRSKREARANRELRQMVADARNELETADDTGDETGDETGENPGGDPAAPKKPVIAESGVLYVYDKLWERNKEMAGWLEIPGTDVAYPVMFTPDYIEKYLRTSFDGNYAVSGTMFLGAGWDPDGNFGIIYGHNMNDGTMFGTLIDLYSNAGAAESHRLIRFDTLTEERGYELVAAFYSRVYGDDEENVFRYYDVRGLYTEEEFYAFLENVRREAIYDAGTDVRWGDKLLLLSTCDSFYATEGRFVVVARYRPADG